MTDVQVKNPITCQAARFSRKNAETMGNIWKLQ
jgi:hypothetical protein